MDVHIPARMPLHDLDGQFLFFLIGHPHPKQDTAMPDLVGIVFLVMLSSAARKNGANDSGWTATNGDGRD